jgi:putative AdoMet-dependent methyltransferase
MTAEDREGVFNAWAQDYDRFVTSATGFPFDGYEAVLDEVVTQSTASVGQTVLDLGIGTGNLAERFVSLGCSVWGLDFSKEMLARASAAVPDVTLVQGGLLGEWTETLRRRFDRVVSSYTLHELDLEAKVSLLERVMGRHLADDGRIVVGDIAFTTREALEKAHRANRGSWDDAEHYWAADEIMDRLQETRIDVSFTKVSSCSGVFVFKVRQG